MTSWTSLPTEEAFITLRALGRVALTLVSKLLERVSNVGQSFEIVEKWLNQHRFALNKAEDQVCLQVL